MFRFTFSACWSVYLLFISLKMNISQKFFFQEKNSLCQSVSDVSVLYAHALLFQISQMIPDMGQVIHPHVPADLSFVIDLLGQE